MGRADADWKNQPQDAHDWLFVAASAVLVATYTGLWLVEGLDHYAGAALVFVAWLAIYFTRHWQPILYLVMGLLLLPITFDLALGGYIDRPLGLVALALTVALIGLLAYLFFAEERTATRPNESAR